MAKGNKVKTENYVFVGKDGRFYKDRWNTFLAGLSAEDKMYADNIMKVYRHEGDWVTSGQLTSRKMRAKLAQTRIESAIINTGYTEEAIAKQLGYNGDLEEFHAMLYDESRWDGSVFSFGGAKWQFVFSYAGNGQSILRRI